MPWTFAHPAAAVPLRRFTPGTLDFAALVAGSMAPDVCYYLRWDIGAFTHSFLGSVAAGVPFGAALLLLFYWLRAPVCFLLPARHRRILLPLAERPAPGIGRAPLIAISLLLGVWSHILWDSFTHKGCFFVEHIALLRAECFWNMPLSYWLHQLSSLLGSVVLCIVYIRWSRAQRVTMGDQTSDQTSDTNEGDRWRFFLLGGLALFSLAVAVPCARHGASVFHGWAEFRYFLFLYAVYVPMIFFPLMIGCALLVGRRGSHAARKNVCESPGIF